MTWSFADRLANTRVLGNIAGNLANGWREPQNFESPFELSHMPLKKLWQLKVSPEQIFHEYKVFIEISMHFD